MASPHGPRFSELTAYESSKKGFGVCTRVKSTRAPWNAEPGSSEVQFRVK